MKRKLSAFLIAFTIIMIAAVAGDALVASGEGAQKPVETGAMPLLPQAQLSLQAVRLAAEDAKWYQKGIHDTTSEKSPLPENPPAYSDEDLYWLSRVIDAEAGSLWMPDWFQQAVGSVVLNRMENERYANTIRDVVFEQGQYYCVDNGSVYEEPSEKSLRNAQYLLEHGSTLPQGILGQSEFVQGDIYLEYHDPYLGSTTYFCYM